MLNMFKKSIALLVGGVAVSMGASAATVVTFDSALGNSNTVYTESGFKFTSLENLPGYQAINIWNGVTNSTPSYAFCSLSVTSGCRPGVHIKIEREDGNAFSFTGFDGTNYDGSTPVGQFDLIGDLAGGGTISAAFDSTSVWLSNSVANFSNVTSITFTNTGAYAAAIDNLSFDASNSVPEPSSLALIGLGLLAANFARKRSA